MARVFVMSLVALLLLAGCSHEEKIDGYGQLELKFMGDSAALARVDLSLSGPGIDNELTSSISLESGATEIALRGVPAGQDRTLTAKAFDKNGLEVASSIEPGIVVEAGKTTAITLVLTAKTNTTNVGGLNISIATNHPPTIEYLSASPRELPVGGQALLQVVASDPDGDPLTYRWQAVNAQFSDASSAVSSVVPQNAGPLLVTVQVSDSRAMAESSVDLSVIEQVQSGLSVVINEILADPPDDVTGDANGDGLRDTNADEFVEILNQSLSSVDISGWSLSDATSQRHIFPAGTILAPGSPLVVFGGGAPLLTASWQLASSGGLSLNNTGDTVQLLDGDGTVVESHSYAGEGGQNQSVVRNPEGTGTFVLHGSVSDFPYSAGTRADRSPF